MIDARLNGSFNKASLPANTARRHFIGTDMWNNPDTRKNAPVWCDTGRVIRGNSAPYPFCPFIACRRIPDKIAAKVDMRGKHDTARYPSSCAMCWYKRGYNTTAISKAKAAHMLLQSVKQD